MIIKLFSSIIKYYYFLFLFIVRFIFMLHKFICNIIRYNEEMKKNLFSMNKHINHIFELLVR